MGYFVDRCKIWVQAGDGGDGCTSFRREKFVPKGGPDGGDGGKGGDVIVTALEGLYTVWMHCLSPHKMAEKGKAGSGKKCRGANGKDLIVYVPVGTQVLCDDQTEVLVDFKSSGQTHVLARGGSGGQGNTRFKSSTCRAPRKHTLGKVGQRFWVWLQVKLLVDVGLIGLPNAGKSSILSRLTKATPKIADYPFTTTDPQVGVLQGLHDQILIVDVPGLIEGASEGRGLGRYFLRHVERCNLLLHVMDVSSKSLKRDYLVVRQELEKHNPELIERDHVIILNKIDLISEEVRKTKVQEMMCISGKSVIAVSVLKGDGMNELKQMIAQHVNVENDVRAQDVQQNDDTTWDPWHDKR